MQFCSLSGCYFCTEGSAYLASHRMEVSTCRQVQGAQGWLFGRGKGWLGGVCGQGGLRSLPVSAARCVSVSGVGILWRQPLAFTSQVGMCCTTGSHRHQSISETRLVQPQPQSLSSSITCFYYFLPTHGFILRVRVQPGATPHRGQGAREWLQSHAPSSA